MKKENKKQFRYLVIILFIILFGIILLSNDKSIQNEYEIIIKEDIIKYSELRKWNPNNDKQAIGLEILISKEDVNEENIIKLIKSITFNTQKSLIKIYQNKQAWEEEKSGNYTDIYKQDYLVFYIKNNTNNGAYQGFNEIRWMQEIGNIQYLCGIKTKF